MTFNIRRILNGFDLKEIESILGETEGSTEYNETRDIYRAFVNQDPETVGKYQKDKRFMVAAAAHCNPLAKLEMSQTDFSKFAIVASVNPSLTKNERNQIRSYTHDSIPVLLESNFQTNNELDGENPTSLGEKISLNSIDHWYSQSFDAINHDIDRALNEILQLMCLELLGFFGEGGDYPFWQILEDSDLEPNHRVWNEFANLPKIPQNHFEANPFAINLHIARELAAEKDISKKSLQELVTDELKLQSVQSDDLWFATRCPRASVAANTHAPLDLISKIIMQEISKIEDTEHYEDDSMSVLWRSVGNKSLKQKQFSEILDFAKRNLWRCSYSGFTYDLMSLLAGGRYVDAPLVDNPSLPKDMQDEISKILEEITKLEPVTSLDINTKLQLDFKGSTFNLEEPFLKWLSSELQIDSLFLDEDNDADIISDSSEPNLLLIRNRWLENQNTNYPPIDGVVWQLIDVNASIELDLKDFKLEFVFHSLSQSVADSSSKGNYDDNDSELFYKISLFRTGERHEYDPELDRSLLALQCLVFLESAEVDYSKVQCEIVWIRLGEQDYPLTEVKEEELQKLSLNYVDKYKVEI